MGGQNVTVTATLKSKGVVKRNSFRQNLMGQKASTAAKDDDSTELRPQSPRLCAIIKGDIKEKYDIGAGDNMFNYRIFDTLILCTVFSELGKGNTATVKRGKQKSSGLVFIFSRETTMDNFCIMWPDCARSAGGSCEIDFQGAPEEGATSQDQGVGGGDRADASNCPSTLHPTHRRSIEHPHTLSLSPPSTHC